MQLTNWPNKWANKSVLLFVRLFWVESPLALTRIFLTGCPPIPDMIYVNGNCYLQAIKIPPNLKQVWRVLVKSFGHSNTAHQIAVFFNLVDVPTFSYIKRKADKL